MPNELICDTESASVNGTIGGFPVGRGGSDGTRVAPSPPPCFCICIAHTLLKTLAAVEPDTVVLVEALGFSVFGSLLGSFDSLDSFGSLTSVGNGGRGGKAGSVGSAGAVGLVAVGATAATIGGFCLAGTAAETGSTGSTGSAAAVVFCPGGGTGSLDARDGAVVVADAAASSSARRCGHFASGTVSWTLVSFNDTSSRALHSAFWHTAAILSYESRAVPSLMAGARTRCIKNAKNTSSKCGNWDCRTLTLPNASRPKHMRTKRTYA